MTTKTLRALIDDSEKAAGGPLEVIVKLDEGTTTRIFEIGAATKQGETFRIYPDPASERKA